MYEFIVSYNIIIWLSSLKGFNICKNYIIHRVVNNICKFKTIVCFLFEKMTFTFFVNINLIDLIF